MSSSVSPVSWLWIGRFDRPSDILAKPENEQTEESIAWMGKRGENGPGGALPPPDHWIADGRLAACISQRIQQRSAMPALKTTKPTIKSTAARLVKELPETASWDDLMYQIYVRQKIEAGMADLKAGRKHSHASIRQEFSLDA